MVFGPDDGFRAVERHGFTHEQGGEDPVVGSLAWPVGSVFISVVSTDPSVLLGFGTWSAFGAGRVLVGLNSGDTDFDTAEETGGSKTQADHTGHGAHGDHDAHSNHRHTAAVGAGAQAGSSFNAWQQDTSPQSSELVDSGTTARTHTAHANNAAISAHGTNMPPYIVVYMWKRVS